ncbi:MAG: pyrroloquinoline quinone biosynthesis peptide chaperone PqqD [Pseudomonadota bacterium]
MADLGDTDVPFLPRGVRVHHCNVRKGWYLLAPERAVKMDQVAAAILSATDGARDFAGIVEKLATDFNAPRDQIARDARRFLVDLMHKRMVEVRP